LWTVRVECDACNVSPNVARRLAKLAQQEKNVEVCCQLACSARRLPAVDDLNIIHGLMQSQKADDPRLPLLVWWAIESKVAKDPENVVDLFREAAIWNRPISRHTVTERLMRRFAATGNRKDLLICAELLRLAPEADDVKRLLTGIEAAYAGRPLTNLPDRLAVAMEKFSGSSVVLGLRQGRDSAVEEVLTALANEQADASQKLGYIQTLGEISQPKCVPSLLRLATTSPDNALRAAALNSLARYDSPGIDIQVLNSYANMSDDVRAAANALLTTRAKWTLNLLRAIDAGHLDKSHISMDVVQRISRYTDTEIVKLVH
jgi:hypothetical protein